MNTYTTAEIAAETGIHPNTVRLYEELRLISKPDRRPNGYRIFTDRHLEQIRLVRLAFQVEILQNGLRKKIVLMVMTAASGDYDTALSLVREYGFQVREERRHAQEAIKMTERILRGTECENTQVLTRKEAAACLHITTDALRNWEMNGLLSVKRKANGYRIYTHEDISRLNIIRSLKCANYSLEAILRMLRELDREPQADIRKALDRAPADADVVTACDQLIASLNAAESNALRMTDMLKDMQAKFL